MKTIRAITAKVCRRLNRGPHVHEFRPDWIDIDDARCRCGARADTNEGGAR